MLFNGYVLHGKATDLMQIIELGYNVSLGTGDTHGQLTPYAFSIMAVFARPG